MNAKFLKLGRHVLLVVLYRLTSSLRAYPRRFRVIRVQRKIFRPDFLGNLDRRAAGLTHVRWDSTSATYHTCLPVLRRTVRWGWGKGDPLVCGRRKILGPFILCRHVKTCQQCRTSEKKAAVRGFVFEKLIFQFSTFSFFARCSLHNGANLFAVGRFVQAKIADFSKFFPVR
jgi:hypothetical protein